MMVLAQRRQDIQHPKRCSIFNANQLTKISTWNVRTLYQCGRLAQLLEEVERYQMDIHGISEMRWTDSERLVSDRRAVIYSDHKVEHTQRVGIEMSPRAAGALVVWNPVSDRIIISRFQTWLSRITIILAYVLIEDAEGAYKDAVYDQLQMRTEIIISSPRSVGFD